MSEVIKKDIIINKRVQELENKLQINSALLSRMELASQMGMTYDGKRNLYQALGYKKQLTYQDYYNQYKREDIAKVVVDKIPDGCWSTKPNIKDETGKEESPFEKGWDDLVKQFKLYSVLNRLDKLLGLGDYAVLLLGFDDSTDFGTELSGTPKLRYLQPYSCKAATVLKFETDKTSERFGLPLLYQIQAQQESSLNQRETEITTISINVHYTRVIHVVEDPLESSIYGSPRMEAIFNRLQDIQKILGSSAEMFWRNASPGRVAKLDKDVTLTPGDKADLKDQFDEYDHNLRKWLRVRGIDIQELSTSIVSPLESIQAQIDIIACVKGIPKRILMGSERGELASSQDEKAWNALLYNRMINFCEPCILRPLIDILIQYKILKEPVGEYVVAWPKMSAIGAKEQADISVSTMDALSKYLAAPGGTDILPLEIFFRDVLHFEEDTVKEILLKMEEAGGMEALDEKLNPVEEPKEVTPSKKVKTNEELSVLGGPGSGNYGHAGRAGKVGGSLGKGVAMSIKSGKDAEERQRAARGGTTAPAKEAPPKEKSKPTPTDYTTHHENDGEGGLAITIKSKDNKNIGRTDFSIEDNKYDGVKGKELYIHMMLVNDAYLGKGYGKALVNELVTVAQKKKVKFISGESISQSLRPILDKKLGKPKIYGDQDYLKTGVEGVTVVYTL